MEISDHGSQRIYLPTLEYDMHIYLHHALFISPSQHEIHQEPSGTVTKSSPRTVCEIVDLVHKHWCVHTTLSDIKPLLRCNDIWSEAFDHHITESFST